MLHAVKAVASSPGPLFKVPAPGGIRLAVARFAAGEGQQPDLILGTSERRSFNEFAVLNHSL